MVDELKRSCICVFGDYYCAVECPGRVQNYWLSGFPRQPKSLTERPTLAKDFLRNSCKNQGLTDLSAVACGNIFYFFIFPLLCKGV